MTLQKKLQQQHQSPREQNPIRGRREESKPQQQQQ